MSKARILSFEGQMLATIELAGSENVCAVARDMIDAGTNVIARLEGSQSAAAFTFALSDRIVAHALTGEKQTKLPKPDDPDIPMDTAVDRAMSFWAIYLMGTAWGAILGFLVGRVL